MMPETIRIALVFLINTLLNLYLFVLMLRAMLELVRANYFNPLTQFSVRLTHHLIDPIRRRLPNFYNIETASVVVIFAIAMIKFFLIALINGELPHVGGISILALSDMLALIIQILTYAILIQAVLSFVQPYSPLVSTLSLLASPIMQPLRRFIPPIAGLDITPIPALIFLQLLSMLLINPLMTLGQGFMIR
ncbi:MAG: hypothetical protein A3F43_02795 [Gammaproteobacteria bacterium RIFCSPHIGHO2_12_FULL_42_10]|nr:MAG: hypothetical protein A3F43_02795 [Gammaproteobacteria bacterium RIFCSPHIGHO2_12_FULL_42_10]